MMGKQSGQLGMIYDMSELIPDKNLLRKINEAVNFDFMVNCKIKLNTQRKP